MNVITLKYRWVLKNKTILHYIPNDLETGTSTVALSQLH